MRTAESSRAAAPPATFQLLPPGPDHSFASQLNKALAPVASLRNGLHGLAGSTLSARVGPAQKLASAETKAAGTLGSLGGPSRYNATVAAVTTALKHEAAALNALAAAAKSGSRSAYSAQSGKVISASRALHSATGALSSAGLGTPAFAVLTLAGPPAPPAATPSSGGSSGTPAPAAPRL